MQRSGPSQDVLKFVVALCVGIELKVNNDVQPFKAVERLQQTFAHVLASVDRSRFANSVQQLRRHRRPKLLQ